jgi:hypothetical protein
VNQTVPFRVVRVKPLNVMAATDEPLGNFSPSTHLDVWRDFKHASCPAEAVNVFDPLPVYAQESITCYEKLPAWTAVCNSATDDLMSTYHKNASANLDCMKKWRAFEQCYGVYAFNSNPNPRPQCTVPDCSP